MERQRLADDTAAPRHQIEDAARQSNLVEDIGQDEGVERRDLARLEDDGTASGNRGRDLRRDLVQRVVPGGDAADDADWLAHHQRVADALLERDLRQDAGQRTEGRQRRPNLDDLRETDRHADLARDYLAN